MPEHDDVDDRMKQTVREWLENGDDANTKALRAACLQMLDDMSVKIGSLRAELSGGMECPRMIYENGKCDLVVSHPLLAHIARESGDLFEQGGGINYVAFRVEGTSAHGPLEIIIQRAMGKTPAEMNVELQAENEKLKSQIAAKGAE